MNENETSLSNAPAADGESTLVDKIWQQEQRDLRERKAITKAKKALREAFAAGVPQGVMEGITRQIWNPVKRSE